MNQQSAISNQQDAMRREHGFTLIELSIVIVIIGLLVGGVLVGQDLIKAAEMRSIVSDIERFKTSHYAYRLKFNAIPGDDNQAETFFGVGNTYNGNGDRWIDSSVTLNEPWLYWQHLALAGLIEGTYSGDNDVGGGWDATIGINVPASSKNGAGYYIHITGADGTFGPNYPTHVLVVGGDNPPNLNGTFEGVFPVADVYALDTKYDDGLANNGNIRMYQASGGHGTVGCTTGGGSFQAYNLSDTSARCHILFSYTP